MPLASIDLLQRYYVAFNSGDMGAFLSLLAEDVVHDINQGGREQGREAFAAFMRRMNRTNREQIIDNVLMADADGVRASAEYTGLGTHSCHQQRIAAGHWPDLPPARRCVLRHS